MYLLFDARVVCRFARDLFARETTTAGQLWFCSQLGGGKLLGGDMDSEDSESSYDEDSIAPFHVVLKVGEEKEIGRDGMKKLLIKEGEGDCGPEEGDEVLVCYTGILLDGTQFASSNATGTPVKFYLGHCQIIDGLNKAIQTMKKGEKAIFTVPSELAYAEYGCPPTIPPNATLQFDIELLHWTTVVDICGDGGVLKKITKEGRGRGTPDLLDEVLVKYNARLEDGTVVSKSEGVEFTVKDGFFCPALARAVETMKEGEIVLLIVKPEYGFGDKNEPAATGDEGTVPSDATLHVDLELLSWKKVIQIGEEQTILKKILMKGDEYPRYDDAVLKVRLIGKLQDGTIFVKKGHDGEAPFEFKSDEELIVDGLEKAVMTMARGEIAVISIPHEHAFGSSGSKQELAIVPPYAAVMYEVELVSFVNAQELLHWKMNTAERIVAGNRKKEEADVLFSLGRYGRASWRYEDALYLLPSLGYSSEDEQVRVLELAYTLKYAACELKLRHYCLAVELCSRVLNLDGGNVEALQMRALAYTKLADLNLTLLEIAETLRIEPDDQELKSEYGAIEMEAASLQEFRKYLRHKAVPLAGPAIRIPKYLGNKKTHIHSGTNVFVPGVTKHVTQLDQETSVAIASKTRELDEGTMSCDGGLAQVSSGGSIFIPGGR